MLLNSIQCHYLNLKYKLHSLNKLFDKNIKKDLRVADLKAVSEIDEAFERSANTIYERKIPQKELAHINQKN